MQNVQVVDTVIMQSLVVMVTRYLCVVFSW